ncbi:Replication initiation and membrane attachment [compost metagenome]
MTAYTKSFGQLVMPETIRDYVKKLKQEGQTDEMIIELMLEAGESSTKPNLRFLEAIGQRWLENGITSREQSKALKNRNNKPASINRSGKPDIAIVSNEPTGHTPTEEEFAELMKLAEQMAAAKEGKHEKDTA